jgi:hypothetical protein
MKHAAELDDFYATLSSLLSILANFIEISAYLTDKCDVAELSDPTDSSLIGATSTIVANELLPDASLVRNPNNNTNDITAISNKPLDPLHANEQHSTLYNFITEIPACTEPVLSSTSFADGVGGWEVFFELASRVMLLLFNHLEGINAGNKIEPGVSA